MRRPWKVVALGPSPVGAYAKKERALVEARKLARRGYTAFVLNLELGEVLRFLPEEAAEEAGSFPRAKAPDELRLPREAKEGPGEGALGVAGKHL